jgi:uncharacterized protein
LGVFPRGNTLFLYPMKIEKISLQHKTLLDERFCKLGLEISEYTFANCFLFRDEENVELIFARELFLTGTSYKNERYLMPTGDLRREDPLFLKQLLSGFDYFYPVPEEWKADLEMKGMRLECDRAESDYIFEVQKIAEYKGRHFDGKRNFVRYFLNHYSPISKELSEDAYLVLKKWEQRPQPALGDSAAFEEACRFYKELGLEGRVWYLEGVPIGAIIGEPLKESMCVVHFAKADISLKGIYPYIFQDFSRNIGGRFVWCNWEQDLGLENLRKAKESYQPYKLLNKWRAAF